MTPEIFAPKTIAGALWGYPKNLEAMDTPDSEL